LGERGVELDGVETRPGVALDRAAPDDIDQEQPNDHERGDEDTREQVAHRHLGQ